MAKTDDPFDRRGVDASARGDLGDRPCDAEAPPQLIGHPRRSHRAAVEDLQPGRERCDQRVGGIEEPTDRAHEPLERVAVDEVCAAEVVDDVRLGHPGPLVAHVVGERQVGHLGAVCVAPLGLSQVHPAYEITSFTQLNWGFTGRSCVYSLRGSRRDSSWSGRCQSLDLPTCCGTPDNAREPIQGQPPDQGFFTGR